MLPGLSISRTPHSIYPTKCNVQTSTSYNFRKDTPVQNDIKPTSLTFNVLQNPPARHRARQSEPAGHRPSTVGPSTSRRAHWSGTRRPCRAKPAFPTPGQCTSDRARRPGTVHAESVRVRARQPATNHVTCWRGRRITWSLTALQGRPGRIIL